LPNLSMAAIHNSPKLEAGPRMPLILEGDALEVWLDQGSDLEDILSLRIPLPPQAERSLHRACRSGQGRGRSSPPTPCAPSA